MDFAFGGLTLPKRKQRDTDGLYTRTAIQAYLPPGERRRLRQERILALLVETGQAKDLAEAAFIELKRAEAAR